MSRRRWRGFAEFEMPNGQTEAIMTVCPGNPDQEGKRFRAIMEAAGAKLDRLYIIEAAELGFHNLKRLIPQNDARSFAKFRGQQWQTNHQEYIDEFMGDRCEVIPMADVVNGTDHEDRIQLIRDMYHQGDNHVTRWFDYSADLDVESRSRRKAENGVIIEPWAIKENSLDYLCEEYSMRSLMHKQFGLDEIYLGLAVQEHDFFEKLNPSSSIDLTIPQVRPITLTEVKMEHVEKLGRAVPANPQQRIPTYARGLRIAS